MMQKTMPVIEGDYLRDILEQPAALERAISRLERNAELIADGNDLRSSRFKQIVLTGMGSSFHAFHPILIELAAAGVPAVMVETSELIYYRLNLFAPDTLVVAVSQSGRSAEILRLLDVNAGRAHLVAVTNDAASPLAQSADAAVLLHAGNESTVSTKTYLTTLLALAWVADHFLGSDLERTIDNMRLLPSAVADYLSAWEEHVAAAQRELQTVERLYYVGRGASLASVGVAGLTTKESAHFPAEGMSAAAFRHGPFELVDRRVFLLAFEGDARTAELNRRLIRDVKLAGGRGAVVRESMDPAWLHVPPVADRMRQVVEILPVQMMTLALAALEGREAGAFALASKVTATE